MFLKIEGEVLINVSLMSKVELFHDAHKRYARLYNAGVFEYESKIAYDFFVNPANVKLLMIDAQVSEG